MDEALRALAWERPAARYAPVPFVPPSVLGKIVIADAEQRKQVIAALKEGIAQGKGQQMAKCFWPRHGILAMEKGKTVEYVICFECSCFEEFIGGKRLRHEPIESTAQPVFDKPLQDAGVPIAAAGRCSIWLDSTILEPR
jgi:hypothetical protein